MYGCVVQMRGSATPWRPQGKSVKILYISRSNRDVVRKKWAAALVHSTVAPLATRAGASAGGLPSAPLYIGQGVDNGMDNG